LQLKPNFLAADNAGLLKRCALMTAHDRPTVDVASRANFTLQAHYTPRKPERHRGSNREGHLQLHNQTGAPMAPQNQFWPRRRGDAVGYAVIVSIAGQRRSQHHRPSDAGRGPKRWKDSPRRAPKALVKIREKFLPQPAKISRLLESSPLPSPTSRISRMRAPTPRRRCPPNTGGVGLKVRHSDGKYSRKMSSAFLRERSSCWMATEHRNTVRHRCSQSSASQT
jgi:hypothetical protein